MRTAQFTIDIKTLMELANIKNFDGHVISAEASTPDTINIFVFGDDDRLPEGDGYPECNLIQKVTIGGFSKII